MFKVNCLNKISPVGMANLTDNYTVTENFDEADIVRHKLVRRIVKAYEAEEKGQNMSENKLNENIDKIE